MPPPTSKPSATGNATEAGRGATAEVNVALPATIVSYDHTTQTATVRLVPCRRRKDPSQGGAVVCYRPPDLPAVPVAFMGGDGFSDTWPLAVGSVGVVLFCDRSIVEWKATGASEVEPQDPRRHDVNDAIFIPAHRPPVSPVPAAGIHATARVLRADELLLGSSAATKAVALAPDVASALSALEAALAAAAAAAGLGATAGDGGVTAFSAFASSLATSLAAWPPTMAASKVKAE